jgi:uncharacterized protein YxeA
MKKIIILLTLCALIVGSFTACKKEKKAEEIPTPPAPVEKVYTPKHQSTTVELKGLKTYAYFNSPAQEVATSVAVNYSKKAPYVKPIEVKYSYKNGDTYTYVIPSTFALWQNEAGKLRVVVDRENTVWLQGQTKSGKFHELIFYGNPKFNGTKIKPNSYVDEIRYSK